MVASRRGQTWQHTRKRVGCGKGGALNDLHLSPRTGISPRFETLVRVEKKMLMTIKTHQCLIAFAFFNLRRDAKLGGHTGGLGLVGKRHLCIGYKRKRHLPKRFNRGGLIIGKDGD